MSSRSRTTIALMLLAGDVGGTKTLVGLFQRDNARAASVHTSSFRTLDFPDLTSLLRDFLGQARVDASTIEAACFGVAGPVEHQRAKLTNVPWEVDAGDIRRQLGIRRSDVINDLQALAWCVPVLEPSEVEIVWEGAADPAGGAALIAAGTGLGVALLPKVAGAFAP